MSRDKIIFFIHEWLDFKFLIRIIVSTSSPLFTPFFVFMFILILENSRYPLFIENVENVAHLIKFLILAFWQTYQRG
jgi:hypothetical protein